MLDLLRSIIDTIGALINFFINTIVSLISLIGQIPNYLTFIISSINILPSFLIPFMMAFISLLVVQYLVNRRAE